MHNHEIKILVVDDRPNNLRVLSKMLTEQGYKVQRAISGQLALNAALAHPPNLILLDILMPGMNGYEVCQRLKANAKTQEIPVIFLSALKETSEKVKAFEMGGVDYITKPFQADEVLARIKHQLTIQQLSQQLQEQNAQLQQEIETRKQMEERNQALLDAIPDLMFRQRVDGTFLDIHAPENRLFAPDDTHIGKNLLDTGLPEAVKQGIFQNIQAAVKTGELQTYEYELPMPDGVRSEESRFVKSGTDEAIRIVRDVTERKQAEERLRLLERAVAASNNGIIISDAQAPNNPIIYVNSGFERLTGYQREEVVGYQSGSFDQTYVAPTVLEELRRALSEGQETQLILHSARKDGTLYWSEFCIAPVRDANGCLTNFIGVQTDITERKQAELALQESQRFIQAIADANPNMLYLYDLIEQRNVYINRAIAVLLDYTPKEIEAMGKTVFSALMHPEDLARLPEHFQKFQTAKEGEIIEFEYRMRHKNGFWCWLYSWDTLFAKDSNGKPWQIIGTATDISARKRVEIELATAKTILERQIQRVLLLEQITQEIRSSLNPEHIFQTAAHQIGQTFGVSRCIIHTYIAQPLPIIPQVAEYHQPGYPLEIEIEIPVIGNPHAELVLSQDSAVTTYDVYCDPLLAGISHIMQELNLKSVLVVRTSYHGKPNGIVCLEQCDRFRVWTAEEIELLEAVAAQMGIALAQANLLQQEKQQRQELAAQNQALEKAKLEAEAANRAKSHFLSKMSHELRTPLNAILGFTQVLAYDSSISPNHQEFISIINRSGEHLLALINDILSMSKIEAGQITLNENCFDLYLLLNSIEAMLGLQASSKGLQFFVEQSPKLPQYIRSDEGKLRQVLINLLGNAIKFTQIGKVALRVRVGEAIPDAQFRIIFEVEDTGSGIAADDLSTLFNPFVQTQTGYSSMEGTGLGLAISRQFIRLMKGDIAVSSQLGKGSSFTFDIQVTSATSADDKIILSGQRVIGLEPNQPTYRVLIVEDVLENRKLLIQLIERLGFEVREATNGQEGVALWESWSPHLICMDLLMPIMDGYQATQQIKQSPKGQNTIIIALTANAFEEERESIFRAGCDDFLPKPFREEDLLEKMAQHLGLRYLYAEKVQSTPPHLAKPRLTSQELSGMPRDWVEQLYQASLSIDDQLIVELIKHVPETQASLIHALNDLVNNFRMDIIIEVTQAYLA